MNFKFTLSKRQWFGGLIGSALSVGLGVICLEPRTGDWLVRRSYDLQFAFRPSIQPDEAAIIFLDDPSHEQLNQPYNTAWDRSLHARLVERLTADGAKMVIFDIIFSDPGPDPKADQRLQQAIKANGKVILGADYSLQQILPNIPGTKVTWPTDLLREASAGIGLTALAPDPDYAVRRHFVSRENVPTLPEIAVAMVEGTTNSAAKRSSADLWLNYYGPPGKIPGYSFYQVIALDGVPTNTFRNKVVFIGAGQQTGFTKEAKDSFATPYSFRSRGGFLFSPGVEIHATVFLNLLRNESLRRFNTFAELLVLIACGAVFGFSLALVRPHFAVALALIIALGTVLFAFLCVWGTLYWFAWLIVVVVQIPVALTFSLVFNFHHNWLEKWDLRRSLECYLPETLVKELLARRKLLKPGFIKIPISIMLTDISNFSTIAELDAQQKLPLDLNKYFDVTTKCIHQAKGTLLKYVGDAIFVIWNAPLEQEGHQELACQAALDLDQAVKNFTKEMFANQIEGPPFPTRIGLHFGEACVGNLGGNKRFDYTAIGRAVNLTSRVEGVNKHLGTSILATDAIVTEGARKKFVFRMVGLFQPKGVNAVKIYELLGPIEQAESTKKWRQAFAESLQQFYSKEFEAAEKGFRQAIKLGDKEDGPAAYYLKEIKKLRENPPGQDWIGVISFDAK